MKTFTKDPGDDLDYKWDFSEWLADGDTIATKLITPDSGISVSNDTITDAGTSVTAFLAGGVTGTTYKVVCKVVTNSSPPRTVERTINLRVKNK